MIPTRETFNAQVARWDLTRGIGFDVETNGREVWEPGARVVGLTLAAIDTERGVPTGLYFPLSHEVGANCDPTLLDDIVQFLLTSRLIPFSAQMEFQWALARWGVRVPIVGDGYIAARLLQLEWFGLKDLVENVLQKSVLRFEDVLGANKYDFSQVDAEREDVQRYVCEDGINAWLIESVLRDKVQAAGMMAVYWLEVQSALVMAEQQLRGYEVDAGLLLREVAKEEARVKNLELDIFKKLNCKPFTINSGVQLGKSLNGLGIHSPLRTPLGKESWTQESLDRLGDVHPVVTMIREWKSGFSVVNSLKRTPPRPATDGCLHPRWRSLGVNGSARMFTENPAITNLPAVARKAFLAPAGKRWMSLDWRHAEMRFLALLSGDTELAALFADGADPWVDLAQLLGLCAPSRNLAKQFMFAYVRGGMDVGYVQSEVGLPLGTVTDLMNWMQVRFPKLHAYLLGVQQYASDTRHVRSWMNRRKKIDGARTADEAMRSALASVLQQSVATAQKVLLNLLVSRADMPLFRGMAHFIPCGEVLYYTLPLDVPLKDHIEAVSAIATMEMIPGLHLGVDWATGPSWGELVAIEGGSVAFAQQFSELQQGGREAA